MTKAWWKSKTIWANVLGAAAEGIQVFAPVLPIPPGTITMVLAGVNIILRRVTTQPIGATDQP